MSCPPAPALPAEMMPNPAHDRPTCRGRRCSRRVVGGQPSASGSPTRGLVIGMTIAATVGLVLALLQLADGQGGRASANTLFAAAGFNLLFTAFYAPLLGFFTLRRGLRKTAGAFFGSIGTGVAYTLGLLFASVVLLASLAVLLG